MPNAVMDSILESWKHSRPPVRPSPQDLANFRQFVTGLPRHPKILMLGITPELVDAAIEFAPERLVVLDIREAALTALASLAEREWINVDLVHGDWREVDTSLIGQFDAIVGHGSFIQLHYPQEWSITASNIYRYLQPGGKLWLRTFVRNENAPAFETYFAERLDAFLATDLERPKLDVDGDFFDAATDIRCYALHAAATEAGQIDHLELARLTEWIRSELNEKLSSYSFWKAYSTDFESPTAVGYEQMWPLAAPSQSAAISLLSDCGYELNSHFGGTRPIEGCFVIISGEKK